jgi:hypothetical protein
MNGAAYVPSKGVDDAQSRDTEASITNKLKRGMFSATFFQACIVAMELDGVALDEI